MDESTGIIGTALALSCMAGTVILMVGIPGAILYGLYCLMTGREW